MTDWAESIPGLEPGSEHRVRLGFERETVTVALDQLVPLKMLQAGVRESKKFAQIVSSIKAIGIVEAPAVAPDPKNAGKYFLLDGHLRVEALRQLEIPTVECLVANCSPSAPMAQILGCDLRSVGASS
jgi:ParB-like chromosome segregation protein Spo0J